MPTTVSQGGIFCQGNFLLLQMHETPLAMPASVSREFNPVSILLIQSFSFFRQAVVQLVFTVLLESNYHCFGGPKSMLKGNVTKGRFLRMELQNICPAGRLETVMEKGDVYIGNLLQSTFPLNSDETKGTTCGLGLAAFFTKV